MVPYTIVNIVSIFICFGGVTTFVFYVIDIIPMALVADNLLSFFPLPWMDSMICNTTKMTDTLGSLTSTSMNNFDCWIDQF